MTVTMAGGADDQRWKSANCNTIAEYSGPWESIQGRRALVLTDVENLFYSARDWDLGVSFQELGRLLRRQATSADLHAFYSCKPGDRTQAERFRSHGWIAHPNEIQTVRHGRLLRRRANSDNVLLFAAGHLTEGPAYEVIVIGSGDGDLGCDLAREIVRRDATKTVVTLSIAGCTSRRLDARSNPYIDSNIEIGLDCLSRRIPNRGAGWMSDLDDSK